jgi:hypothetical protein
MSRIQTAAVVILAALWIVAFVKFGIVGVPGMMLLSTIVGVGSAIVRKR